MAGWWWWWSRTAISFNKIIKFATLACYVSETCFASINFNIHPDERVDFNYSLSPTEFFSFNLKYFFSLVKMKQKKKKKTGPLGLKRVSWFIIYFIYVFQSLLLERGSIYTQLRPADFGNRSDFQSESRCASLSPPPLLESDSSSTIPSAVFLRRF